MNKILWFSEGPKFIEILWTFFPFEIINIGPKVKPIIISKLTIVFRPTPIFADCALYQQSIMMDDR